MHNIWIIVFCNVRLLVFYFILFYLFILENADSIGLMLSENAAPESENSPKFVESEDLDSLSKRQFKTAEIADALMGSEAPIDPAEIESLIPKNAKDSQAGFLPPCDENSAQCGPLLHVVAGASLEEEEEGESTELTQQVGI